LRVVVGSAPAAVVASAAGAEETAGAVRVRRAEVGEAGEQVVVRLEAGRGDLPLVSQA